MVWSFLLTLTKSYQLTVLLMSVFVVIGWLIFVFRNKLSLLLIKEKGV